MKVFLSWSGPRSRDIAREFDDWIRQCLQAVEPWQSADMEKGVRWDPEISRRLENSDFGIIFLTKSNLRSQWIHFEAGALSNLAGSRVYTFLVDLKPSDIDPPLAQFQHTQATKEDVKRLFSSLNHRLKERANTHLSDEILNRVFETNWPAFKAAMEKASILEEEGSGARPSHEMLEELLQITRSVEKRLGAMQVRDLAARARETYDFLTALRGEPRSNDLMAAIRNELEEHDDPVYREKVRQALERTKAELQESIEGYRRAAAEAQTAKKQAPSK